MRANVENDLMFGTLDTWLLYKLNGGQHHVTEPSNAISTGKFAVHCIICISRHIINLFI